MQRVSTRFAAGVAVAASALSLGAVGAQATKVPATQAKPAVAHTNRHAIQSGQVAFKPTQAVLTFLSTNHIKVTPLAPATWTNGQLVLPITRGVVSAHGKLRGRAIERGAIVFSAGGRSFRLHRFRVRHLGAVPVLTARNGRGRLLLIARVRNLQVSRSGHTATATGELTLTARAAALVNRLVGRTVVSRGYDLGALTSVITTK
jgi:hypothetical protein